MNDVRKNADIGDPEVQQRLHAAEPYCERLGIALAMGHFEQADRILQSAKGVMRSEGRDGTPFLDRPLVDLVDVRTANTVESHFGAVTIGDVLEIDRGRLLAVSSFGERMAGALLNRITEEAINEVLRLEAEVVELRARGR